MINRNAPLMHLYWLMLNQEVVSLDVSDFKFHRVLSGWQSSGIGPDVLAENTLTRIFDVLIVLVDNVVYSVDSVWISHQ